VSANVMRRQGYAWLALLLNLTILGGAASAQTTQPSEASLDALLKQAAKEPLAKESLVGPGGKPLLESDLADVQRAGQLTASAEEARTAGQYDAGAKSAAEATGIYERLLGRAHHRTQTATALSQTLSRIAAASPEDRQRMAEADKLHANARSAHDEGNYYDAAHLAEQALGIRERLLGREHPYVAETLRVLGNAQIELQWLDKADPSLARAVEIVEKVFGKSHPQMALTLDRQGWLRISQQRFSDAVSVLSDAVRIGRATTGDTAELAEALDNLGTALVLVGSLDRGLAAKLRAYVVREKVLGPDARDTGVSLSNIAWTYSRMGGDRAAEVVPLRRRALAVFEKALGPEHPYVYLEMGNLAREYASRGEMAEAVKLYEEMVSRDRQHPDRLNSRVIERLATLGRLYLQSDRLDEGRRLLQQAMELVSALKDKGDVAGAIAETFDLGEIYQQFRMYEDAVAALEQGKAWGPRKTEAPTEASIERATRLGACYCEAGRLAEATAELRRAVDDAVRLFGKEDVKTVSPLLTLSQALERAGKLEEAEQTADQALRIAEAKLRRTSAGYAYTLSLMGQIQIARKELDLAKFSLEEAQRVFELPQNHDGEVPALVGVLLNLGRCKIALGEKDEGLKLCREAVRKSLELADRSEGPGADALLARAVKQLWDSLKEDPAADKSECEALEKQLRSLLNTLRDAHALSAENAQWLKELGG